MRYLALLSTVLFWTAALAQNILPHEKPVIGDGYRQQEISFPTGDSKYTMHGTLLMPAGDFIAAAIIVPGTGMDTRNSHYKLASALLGQNIAVFRYDDRGVGDSGGRYNRANNTVTMLANDLLSCITTLRKQESLTGKKIGLIGHSEGGMVTMLAHSSGGNAAFLVQIATPVTKHGEFIKYQLKTGQNSFSDLLNYPSTEEKLAVMTSLHQVVAENNSLPLNKLHRKLDKKAKELGYGKQHYTRFPYLTLMNEIDLVRKDLEPAYRDTTVPVLYLIGDNDTYVDPVGEPAKLKQLSNSNIKVMTLPGLNHYLVSQKLSIGNLYDIDEVALKIILQWLKPVI